MSDSFDDSKAPPGMRRVVRNLVRRNADKLEAKATESEKKKDGEPGAKKPKRKK